MVQHARKTFVFASRSRELAAWTTMSEGIEQLWARNLTNHVLYSQFAAQSVRVNSKRWVFVDCNLPVTSPVYCITNFSYRKFADEWPQLTVTERHRVRIRTFDELFPDWRVYNFCGTFIIFIGKTAYVIDVSALDILRICATSFRQFWRAAIDYRLSDRTDREAVTYRVAALKCYTWIMDNINQLESDKLELLPRHMHLCMERLINLIGEGEARVSYGAATLDPQFHENINKTLDLDVSWYTLIQSLGLDERVSLDFAKIHHCLPPPGADMRELFQRVKSFQGKPKKLSARKLREFINCSASYDLCRYLRIHRKAPNVSVDKSYKGEWLETDWAKSCLRGRLQLPPPKERGKVRISGHFK